MRAHAWSPDGPDAEREFQQVLALAKNAKATLGFLPDAAFRNAAAHRGLLTSVDFDGTVAGYVLYSPARGLIKLVHVCVAPRFRKQNVARQLVDLAVALNPAATAVQAACRRDYGIDDFWRSLGMTPRAEKPGRKAGGSILTVWNRPLGEPDLFESALLSSGLPLAILDSNVVADLFSSDTVDRRDRDEALVLRSSWLLEQVNFAVTTAFDDELNRLEDKAERDRQWKLTSDLDRVRTARPADTRIEKALLELVPPPVLRRDSSLEDDAKHLADAINAGADFFVTQDQNVLSYLQPALDKLGYELRLVRPSGLVVAVQLETEGPVFDSRELESADLVWQDVTPGAEEELTLAFLSYALKEKPSEFHRTLRELIANRTGAAVLLDHKRRHLALVATTTSGTSIEVPLLRVARGQAGTTIALQMARHLRRQARNARLDHVRILDERTGDVVLSALADDGFDIDAVHPTARLIDEVLSPDSVAAALGTQFKRTPTASDVASLERRFWPLIVKEETTRCYVIPIRPGWSERLFAWPPGLLNDRKPGLGLSREHVYFRSPKGGLRELAAPSRIFWYVSASGNNVVRQLALTSRLVESSRLSVSDAHKRFGHIGAYTLQHIKEAANGEPDVHVVRFEDTEVLARPLGRRDLEVIKDRHEVSGIFLTVREVPAAFFHDVLELQKHD